MFHTKLFNNDFLPIISNTRNQQWTCVYKDVDFQAHNKILFDFCLLLVLCLTTQSCKCSKPNC